MVLVAKRGKVKFNVKGFAALREDRNVQRDVVSRAKKIADASGGEDKGYLVRDNLARDGRSGASVIAIGHAANSNRKHQTLIRNLPEGRSP